MIYSYEIFRNIQACMNPSYILRSMISGTSSVSEFSKVDGLCHKKQKHHKTKVNYLDEISKISISELGVNITFVMYIALENYIIFSAIIMK